MSKTNPDKCGFASPLSLRSFHLDSPPSPNKPYLHSPHAKLTGGVMTQPRKYIHNAHENTTPIYVRPNIFTHTHTYNRPHTLYRTAVGNAIKKKCSSKLRHIENREITATTLKLNQVTVSNHQMVYIIPSPMRRISSDRTKFIFPTRCVFFVWVCFWCWFNQNENQTSLAQFIMLRHTHARTFRFWWLYDISAWKRRTRDAVHRVDRAVGRSA